MNLTEGLALVSLALVECGGGAARAPSPTPAPASSMATAPSDASGLSAPVSSTAAPAASSGVDSGAPSGPAQLSARPLPLPGATGPAFLDYIVYEPARARVWVPVGSTGSVDVLDTAKGSFTRVDGFKTEERESGGKKRTYGPSAASVGDGFVYIGNRASNEVCPVEASTLKVSPCTRLAAATDGVAYVASSKEVWVTTPRAQALTVLDASNPGALKVKTTVKVEGEPEGYAVDDGHGVFFTNLEDKGKTLAIDVKTHKVKASWNPGCGADGPRGLAFDAAHDFVVVACTDHVQVLDAGHEGAPLGRFDTGAGLDNIDFVGERVYAAAGKASRLTVAAVDEKGQLVVVGTGDTSGGARNAVADANGNAYVADSQGARILVLSPVVSR